MAVYGVPLPYAVRSLLAQKKQFDTLAANTDETRRVHHDLRQHLTAMQSYIASVRLMLSLRRYSK